MGDHPPRNATAQHIQNAVYYFPQVHGARMSPGIAWGQQRSQLCPLGVGQGAWICFSIHTPKVSIILDASLGND